MPSTPARTVLITAGEASGDRLGGALMAALKAQHPNLRFIGVGGPQMEGQGLVSAFPMSDLAVMGLLEVIPSIPRILGRIKQLTELAKAEQPDLAITIDSQDFSSRLAKSLQALNTENRTLKHIHYVAPKVWAWRQHRVHKLKHLYTHLLSILPFEQSFFATAGIPTTYVGHPAVTTLAPYHAKTTSQPILALLPGSRSGELKRHWPLFLQTYRELKAAIPTLSAVLALPNERALNTCKALAGWTDADAITAVFGEDRFAALAKATAALSKSGTNNLELALIGTPAVVTYRMNALTYLLAKKLVKVPYISLPNLILHNAGKLPAYPEFIQHAANQPNLAAELYLLLTNQVPAAAQRNALKSLKDLMQTPKPPAQMAAEAISSYL